LILLAWYAWIWHSMLNIKHKH